jgi:hypothetical protein
LATTAFRSRPLPSAVTPLRTALIQAHGDEPFRPIEPRLAARRAGAIAEGFGWEVTVYRGALDLAGVEADHVWIDLDGHVIDVAFPLFVPDFVDALRRYVVGDAEASDLEAAAASAGLEQRVLGEFPSPLRYRGEPVWSARH